MSKYTFYVGYVAGVDKYVDVEASTEKDAHKKVWDSLTYNERDAVESLDCVDVEECATTP